MKKTSYQWYMEDQELDIYDPDGWRDLPIDQRINFFFLELIDEKDYYRRRNHSSIGNYNSRMHRSPYGSLSNFLTHQKANILLFDDFSSFESSEILETSSELDKSIDHKNGD